MPILSDVESTLVTACAAALYPNGDAATSAVGAPCRAYVGWPVSAALDKSIAAGTVDISVFSHPGMSRNTTRYPVIWQQLSLTPPTLTATVAGNQVTIGGGAGVAQLVGIQVNGVPYVYAASASDTPATAAAAPAKLVPGASASGATITLPAGAIVIARTGGYATASMEVRREWQELQVTIWSPTPELRDAVSAVLDLALAQMPWLPLADGSSARLRYRGTTTTDVTQKSSIWRRDLMFGAEFGVSAKSVASQMLFAQASTQAS